MAQEQGADADLRVVTPGYFRTLGIRLVRGRDFSELDGPGAPPTVLVSEAAARRYWPGEDPVGRRIRVGDVLRGRMYTIVGVVGDVRYQSRETPDVRPMLYFSALARPERGMTLLVRGAGRRVGAGPIRQVIASLDPGLPPAAVSAMDELLADALATPRFALVLFAVFAGAALALAGVGVYGVMSYLVRQRTQELGVRSALGAPTSALVLGVIGGALQLTVAGVVLGLAGAWALTKSIAALLFDVSPTDPLTFAAVALLLTTIGALASALPARRAARADPLLALRGE
jgi:predicted permease